MNPMPISAPPDTALLSVSWLNYYRHNRESLLPIPWERGAELNEAELAAVAASIQEFQLGESSEGKHLVQRAEEFARREGLSAYAEAVKLFVAEEHRHARDLGRVLDLAGVPRLRKAWADSVFRRLRHLANLEMSIRVLITAEIIAKVYYAALRDATGSTVLRTLCDQITRDEREHVRFQCDYLAIPQRKRGSVLRRVVEWGQRLLYAGACWVVWKNHRRALRRGGMNLRSYRRRCRDELRAALQHIRSGPRLPTSQDALSNSAERQ